MRSFELNKLIRAGLLDSMREMGQKVTCRRLRGRELLAEFSKKMVEEASEFDPNSPKPLIEIADGLAVLEDATEVLGHKWSEVEELEAKKRAERGGFTEGVYVERIELSDDDPFVDYCAADPKRFPEINND